MKTETPFVIENEEFENHMVFSDDTSDSLPFEFSRSRMWNESFYSPEIGNGHSITVLSKELAEIKELIGDIKKLLKDIFEIEGKSASDI